MSSNQVLSADLIISQLEAANVKEIIESLGNKLHAFGYVKDSYVPAVIKREGIFPTGLPLGNINVAIPHTDVEHVNKPAIAVATLANPVAFGNMGDSGNTLKVSIVFLLAMKEPHAQVDLLQNLVETFQNPEVLEILLGAANPKEIEKILKQYLKLKEVH
jgi:PTS system galactitol-specific IIA component